MVGRTSNGLLGIDLRGLEKARVIEYKTGLRPVKTMFYFAL